MLNLDLSPLKKYPDYRWLYTGQTVSFFGSMITYVAIPYQMFELTKSTFDVGLLGLVQLVPLVLSGFLGGALADGHDRKKVAVISQWASVIGCLGLIAFSVSKHQNHLILYALSAFMVIFKGIERPALEALTQQLIEKKDIPKVSTLQSLKNTSGMILGPALGGVLISTVGVEVTYVIDLLTFLVGIFCVLKITASGVAKDKRKASVSSIKDGFLYAWKRPDLLGTYVVDMASMIFAFPNPLFPAIAAVQGPGKLGWLYSATAIGAFCGSITSGWTHARVSHGRHIMVSAFFWCVGIFLFGWTDNFYLGLVFLGFAGWADMISGIFRSTMWNETIPEEYRGRLASVEMISYASGPLLGNTFMGFLADKQGPSFALMSGGIIGGILVLLLGFGIKEFWRYKAVRSP